LAPRSGVPFLPEKHIEREAELLKKHRLGKYLNASFPLILPDKMKISSILHDFECSRCGRPMRHRTPVTTVYCMTVETLARPKPAIATADVESALRELDQFGSVFRPLGRVWVLKYEGETVLMEDTRGLSYLARLLAEPDRIVPAASLLAAVAGIDPRITTGTSGRLLDDEAMTKYKQRYAELQEDLEEAESRHDLGRIAQIKSELDAFATEIARATGLGGRQSETTRKPLVWLHVEVKTPPFTPEGRQEAGVLPRLLQEGERLGMAQAEPLPDVGRRCGALRIRDAEHNWRIMYRIDADAILVVEVYPKKTRKIPDAVIEGCKQRLKRYDATVRAAKKKRSGK